MGWGQRKGREKNSAAPDARIDFPHSCHLPPRREAPRVANCTWHPGSSIQGHWCLASPLPGSFTLCAWVSSFSVAHKYLQLLHALANGINLHIFLGQRRACPTLVLRNREEQFLTHPSHLYSNQSQGEKESREEGTKKGKEKGQTNILKCKPNVKGDLSSVFGEQTRRAGLVRAVSVPGEGVKSLGESKNRLNHNCSSRARC